MLHFPFSIPKWFKLKPNLSFHTRPKIIPYNIVDSDPETKPLI